MSRAISGGESARLERPSRASSLAVCGAIGALLLVFGAFACFVAHASEPEPGVPVSTPSQTLQRVLPSQPACAALDLPEQTPDGQPVPVTKATLSHISSEREPILLP